MQSEHIPATQCCPAPQAFPQRPQLRVSFCVLTQLGLIAVPHSVGRSAGQRHIPASQTPSRPNMRAQFVVQFPQKNGFVMKSTLHAVTPVMRRSLDWLLPRYSIVVSQRAPLPAAQRQAPATQSAPFGTLIELR